MISKKFSSNEIICSNDRVSRPEIMSEINYNCCLVKDIIQLSIKEILLEEMSFLIVGIYLRVFSLGNYLSKGSLVDKVSFKFSM